MDANDIIKHWEHHPKGITETRQIERGGKRFTLTRSDPFGFVEISIFNYSGELKDELKGNFMSMQEAEIAIQRYLSKRKAKKPVANKPVVEETKEA